MKTLTIAFLLTLSLRLTSAQNATIPILKLNQPLEQQIKAGETQTFQIALQAGEFMHVEAMQKGIDVVVSLYAPDGQLLLERDSPNGTDGLESVSYLATATGNHQLTVSVLEAAPVKQGGYAIELKAIRQPTSQNQKRIAAETALQEVLVLRNKARTLRDEGSVKESESEFRQALAKCQESLSFWRELDERYWEGQTLRMLRSLGVAFENLGQKYLDLGEFAKAKESYQTAFRVAKEVEDTLGLIANSQNLERVSQRLKAKSINAELVIQTGHTSTVPSIAFSPDGKNLVSGSWDGAIKLWDVASSIELRTLATLSDSMRSFAFSPDGKTVASGGNLPIRLWDITSGTELRTLSGHSSAVSSIAFSPDGKNLASSEIRDFSIKLWDTVSGTELRTFSGHKYFVRSVAFSPDGKMLASMSGDGISKLWDVASGSELRTLSDHSSAVSSIAFSPDGKNLASSEIRDFSIKLWDTVSGTELRTFSGHKNIIRSVAFSPDGRTLVSGSSDKTIKLWDVVSGTELRTLSGHTDGVASVIFAPDGKTLASGSDDHTIKLWDTVSGNNPRTFTGQAARVECIAIAPDSKTLAIGGRDKTIKLWDIISATELQTFSGHSDTIWSVAFSPDGKTLASGSPDKTIKLWDIASGAERHTLSVREGAVYSVAFAPDSKTLVSENQTVLSQTTSGWATKAWDVASGKELPSFRTLPLSDSTVRYRSPDLETVNGKKLLIVPTRDGQINFINFDTGERLCSLIFLSQKDWVVVTPDSLFDASPSAMKLMHFVISGIDEGYVVVALEQMKDRYYHPNLLPKLLGFDNTPIKEIAPFTGEKLFPKLEYKWQENNPTKLDINLHNRGGGIGEVAVLVNGKTFRQDVRPRGFNPNAKDASFTVELKDAPFLPGAANQIEVVARNAEGWLTSPRGVKATYTPAAAAAKPDAELWAIVGGVSDYEGTQLDLHFAAKDAEDFANAIKLGGYRLFGANRVHLQTLTTNAQDPKLLPTKENFRRVFTEFQKAKPNDVLLVYLSGHGVAFRVNGDKVLYNYLTQAATNGDVKDSDVRNKVAITSDELMEWIRLIPTNKNVLVFDTCAAGAFADNLNLALKKDEAGEHLDNQKIAMEDLKYRMGFHILMGAAADKPSYETSQFNQGLLTYALLEGVKFGAVNDKKIVNVSELFQYARSRVPKLAESIGNVNIQMPQIAAPQGETFPLLQMTVNESELIHLEKERPILMRPRLVNLDDPDDVEVENRLIRQLKEASQPVKRGDAARSSQVVFLETWELPSAIKPSGSYKYEGEQVIVNLKLLRGKQTVGTLTVAGKKNDLRGLVEKIIAELVVAIEKLPKTIPSGTK